MKKTPYRPKITDFPALQIVPVEETPTPRIDELREEITPTSITPEVVDSVWITPKKGSGGAN